jgi:hypothetical protein
MEFGETAEAAKSLSWTQEAFASETKLGHLSPYRNIQFCAFGTSNFQSIRVTDGPETTFVNSKAIGMIAGVRVVTLSHDRPSPSPL